MRNPAHGRDLELDCELESIPGGALHLCGGTSRAHVMLRVRRCLIAPLMLALGVEDEGPISAELFGTLSDKMEENENGEEL